PLPLPVPPHTPPRQTLEPQQARRIITTVNHGPRLSLRCSKTQRGSRSRGPPSFRRAPRAQPQVARSRSKSRIAGGGELIQGVVALVGGAGWGSLRRPCDG